MKNPHAPIEKVSMAAICFPNPVFIEFEDLDGETN
jgi:hypothetical protein